MIKYFLIALMFLTSVSYAENRYTVSKTEWVYPGKYRTIQWSNPSWEMFSMSDVRREKDGSYIITDAMGCEYGGKFINGRFTYQNKYVVIYAKCLDDKRISVRMEYKDTKIPTQFMELILND